MKIFLNSIGFLTIIKIPQKLYLKNESFWKISGFFPLTGILIGALMAAIYFAARFVFPSFICVLLSLGFEVLITGAMHLDGYSDTIDGVFSGETDKAKILEIMKKSDIGVFGVVALIFLFAFKFSFFYLLVNSGNGDNYGVLAAIMFMPAFGRWAINYNLGRYGKLKRTGSLAVSFINEGNRKLNSLTALYLFYLVLLQASLFGYFLRERYFLNFSGIALELFKKTHLDSSLIFILSPIIKIGAVIIIAYGAVSAISRFFLKKVGGLSGDVMGAVVEITEVVFLFLCYLSARFI